MEQCLKVFYSNRVEELYNCLKERLFSHPTHPFAQRFVVVPSPAMKNWLMTRLADDPDIGIAAGMTVTFLEPALFALVERYADPSTVIPKSRSHLELALLIEREIRRISEEQSDPSSAWAPLIEYLHAEKASKRERRRIALADKLAFLFLEYEKYGLNLLKDWKEQGKGGWQGALWRTLLGQTWPEEIVWKSGNAAVHLFATSFLSRQQHRLLEGLSQVMPVNYYLLSPCQVFWSDILSDWEGRKLEKTWETTANADAVAPYAEEYLYNRNPLLANFGRLGREMATQVEESGAITEERYQPPEEADRSLLAAVQRDLLELRNPKEKENYPNDRSIQIHIASSHMREVQALHDTLLGIIERHAGDKEPIRPEDCIVMAPNIMDYEPYIHTVFHASESPLDCQIMDLEMFSQNSLVQGFMCLLSLASSRWDAASLLQLFEYPAFQKKQGLDGEDLQRIRDWVQAARVRWEEDEEHRQNILSKHHGSCNIVDRSPVGTWQHAIDRLLLGLTMVPAEEEISPLPIIETTQSELLGKWIYLLRSLRADLVPLSDGTELTVNQWVAYLNSLLEGYFSLIPSEQCSEEEIEMVRQLINAFHFGKDLGSTPFSFSTIKYHLEAAAKKQRICYRENYLHTVRFCSLLPMRAVPAKVVVLMGLNEGAFPRIESLNSLNYLQTHAPGDYRPTTVDFDRYLFLEILLSARKYFVATFTGYSREDNKEQPPSLLITELLSYLDKGYTINLQPSSQYLLIRHPFKPYDRTLYEENGVDKSFSKPFFRAAKAYYQREKGPKHCFVPSFKRTQTIETIVPSHIPLRNLALMARNPIEAYFNLTLGMRLEKEEKRLVKTDEDFLLSALDSAILKKNSLKKPIKEVLRYADEIGNLPIGPFKKYAVDRIVKDAEAITTGLQQLGINPETLFEITFTEHCEGITQVGNQWRLPPLEVSYCGQPITITGSFNEVSELGWVAYAKDDKKEVIKNWPQYLVFHCLVEQYGLEIGSELVFAKSGKARIPYFKKAAPILERYLKYYFQALETISPLLPEWVPELMEKDTEGFKNKLSSLLSGDSPYFYNDYMKWIAQGGELPQVAVLQNDWKQEAEELFGELYANWYQPKKAGSER